jgi:hypothetical protein
MCIEKLAKRYSEFDENGNELQNVDVNGAWINGLFMVIVPVVPVHICLDFPFQSIRQVFCCVRRHRWFNFPLQDHSPRAVVDASVTVVVGSRLIIKPIPRVQNGPSRISVMLPRKERSSVMIEPGSLNCLRWQSSSLDSNMCCYSKRKRNGQLLQVQFSPLCMVNLGWQA